MNLSEAKNITLGDKPVQKVYVGEKLVYPKIPSEYNTVNYITSNGTQHITLPFSANQDTRIDFKAEIIEFQEGTGNEAFFGNRNSYTSNTFTFWSFDYGESMRFDYNSTQKKFLFSTLQVNDYSINKNKAYVNGELYAEHLYNTFQSSNQLRIFDVNPTSTNPKARMNLYYFKVWDNGVLKFDLVPVVRNSDGVAGLYCKETNTFYPQEVGDNFTWS